MAYEFGFGPQPDEWIEDDWRDENGNYHDVSELGGLRTPVIFQNDDEDIPF